MTSQVEHLRKAIQSHMSKKQSLCVKGKWMSCFRPVSCTIGLFDTQHLVSIILISKEPQSWHLLDSSTLHCAWKRLAGEKKIEDHQPSNA